MIRTRQCSTCGRSMTYEVSRGKDRKYCSKECSGKARKDAIESKVTNLPDCTTEGCYNKATRVGAGLCEACYGRVRRRGTTDFKQFAYRAYNPAGYARIRESNHPLADSTGTVYEHRFVYYNHHGAGPFACHWCGKAVTWETLDIDHVDCNIKNNVLSNLVTSCPKCNRTRGKDKMVQTMWEKRAVKLTYAGRTMRLTEWAEEIGISRGAMQFRIKNGWTMDRIFNEPKGKSGPKPKHYQKTK